MRQQQFAIDPAHFTKGQWEELFNATDLVPTEFHDRAIPVRRGERAIRAAINHLITLRGRIQLGLLGPENRRGENRRWIRDLEGAAEVLRELLLLPSRQQAQAD